MHELFTSLFILDELSQKLVAKIGASRAEARAVTRLFRSRSEVVEPVVWSLTSAEILTTCPFSARPSPRMPGPS